MNLNCIKYITCIEEKKNKWAYVPFDHPMYHLCNYPKNKITDLNLFMFIALGWISKNLFAMGKYDRDKGTREGVNPFWLGKIMIWLISGAGQISMEYGWFLNLGGIFILELKRNIT